MWYEFKSVADGDSAPPSQRECHSCCATDDSLVIYGGNDNQSRYGEVHILNTTTMRWTKHLPLPPGQAPVKRSAHAAVIVEGRYLMTFGGWDGQTELGDLSAFDTVSKAWSKVSASGNPPVPRHFHSMVALGRRLFVFGGYDGSRWRNDIVSLDLDTLTWEILRPGGSGPGPRASATMIAIDGDKLALFGGYDGTDFLNDLFVLHTVHPGTGNPDFWWERVLQPKPLAAAPGITVSGGDAGGTVVPSPGAGGSGSGGAHWPEPRSGHAVETAGPLMFVIGGRHRSGRFNDVQVLNTNTWTWSQMRPAGEPFRARKTHSVARVGNRVFLFGGHDGASWMGDMHVLDLGAYLAESRPALTVRVPTSSLLSDLASTVTDIDLSMSTGTWDGSAWRFPGALVGSTSAADTALQHSGSAWCYPRDNSSLTADADANQKHAGRSLTTADAAHYQQQRYTRGVSSDAVHGYSSTAALSAQSGSTTSVNAVRCAASTTRTTAAAAAASDTAAASLKRRRGVEEEEGGETMLLHADESSADTAASDTAGSSTSFHAEATQPQQHHTDPHFFDGGRAHSSIAAAAASLHAAVTAGLGGGHGASDVYGMLLGAAPFQGGHVVLHSAENTSTTAPAAPSAWSRHASRASSNSSSAIAMMSKAACSVPASALSSFTAATAMSTPPPSVNAHNSSAASALQRLMLVSAAQTVTTIPTAAAAAAHDDDARGVHLNFNLGGRGPAAGGGCGCVLGAHPAWLRRATQADATSNAGTTAAAAAAAAAPAALYCPLHGATGRGRSGGYVDDDDDDLCSSSSGDKDGYDGYFDGFSAPVRHRVVSSSSAPSGGSAADFVVHDARNHPQLQLRQRINPDSPADIYHSASSHARNGVSLGYPAADRSSGSSGGAAHDNHYSAQQQRASTLSSAVYALSDYAPHLAAKFNLGRLLSVDGGHFAGLTPAQASEIAERHLARHGTFSPLLLGSPTHDGKQDLLREVEVRAQSAGPQFFSFQPSPSSAAHAAAVMLTSVSSVAASATSHSTVFDGAATPAGSSSSSSGDASERAREGSSTAPEGGADDSTTGAAAHPRAPSTSSSLPHQNRLTSTSVAAFAAKRRQSAQAGFFDVAFIVEGHYRVRLHRVVLASRCQYFGVMFSSPSFAESAGGVDDPIVESEMDLTTFTAIMRWIYTEQLPPPDVFDSVLLPLCAAAERLGLTRLSRLCQRHLESYINSENAPAMLEHADTHAAGPLRAACMRFLLSNYHSSSLTPGFVTLREDLLREILVRRVIRENRAREQAEAAIAAAAAAAAASVTAVVEDGGGGADAGRAVNTGPVADTATLAAARGANNTSTGWTSLRSHRPTALPVPRLFGVAATASSAARGGAATAATSTSSAAAAPVLATPHHNGSSARALTSSDGSSAGELADLLASPNSEELLYVRRRNITTPSFTLVDGRLYSCNAPAPVNNAALTAATTAIDTGGASAPLRSSNNMGGNGNQHDVNGSSTHAFDGTGLLPSHHWQQQQRRPSFSASTSLPASAFTFGDFTAPRTRPWSAAAAAAAAATTPATSAQEMLAHGLRLDSSSSSGHRRRSSSTDMGDIEGGGSGEGGVARNKRARPSVPPAAAAASSENTGQQQQLQHQHHHQQPQSRGGGSVSQPALTTWPPPQQQQRQTVQYALPRSAFLQPPDTPLEEVLEREGEGLEGGGMRDLEEDEDAFAGDSSSSSGAEVDALAPAHFHPLQQPLDGTDDAALLAARASSDVFASSAAGDSAAVPHVVLSSSPGSAIREGLREASEWQQASQLKD